MEERVSLIKAMASDRKETEAIKVLNGVDAQAFVDTVDEVPPHDPILEFSVN